MYCELAKPSIFWSLDKETSWILNQGIFCILDLQRLLASLIEKTLKLSVIIIINL